MGTKDSKTDGEYITIPDYARARNVSTTAVYKRLEKGLKPWYRVIDGKKLLLSSVLYEEAPKNKPNVTNERSITSNPENITVINLMKEEITRLQAQIDAQRAEIKEKDAKIAEFAGKFAELANQAQHLHAAQTMIEAKSTAAVEDTPAEEKPAEKKKRRGFFSWLTE